MACLPNCLGANANDAAASLVATILSDLADLLMAAGDDDGGGGGGGGGGGDGGAGGGLSYAQIEALLQALRHVHHFCIFGEAEVGGGRAAAGGAAGGGGGGAPNTPPRSPSAALAQAQRAMHNVTPHVPRHGLKSGVPAVPHLPITGAVPCI